ncbi:MAG: hypothetical protein AAGA99_07910 [Actinomycetota bacterium]
MELDALRLLVGVVHAVPGASASFTRHDGELLVVDRTRNADVDPCTFRTVLVQSVRCGRPTFADTVATVEIGGTLEDRGGGVFATPSTGEVALRWFGSLLSPPAVRGALIESGIAADDDIVAVSLCGDTELGMTVGRVELIGSVDPVRADELCLSMLASCLVAELEIDAQGATAG